MKVLVLKFGALGDVIIAASALHAIGQVYGYENLTLVTDRSFASLFSGWQGLRCRPVDRKSWLSVCRTGMELYRDQYEVVFDLQCNKKSRWMSWLTRARVRVGLWPGWPYHIGGDVPRRARAHPGARYASALPKAGIPYDQDRSPPLLANAEDRTSVEKWLSRQTLPSDHLILMHPGSSVVWPTKRWPVRYFERLATRIEQAGFKVLWIGGREDRAVCDLASQSVGINTCGQWSVGQLIFLASHSKAAVTNDSAPMHALASAGLPVYAIFGPTDWRWSHALRNRGRVIPTEVACAPCYARRCPLKKNKLVCLTSITPESVFEKMRAEGLLVAPR